MKNQPHAELKDRQPLFAKAVVKNGIPYWPNGTPLDGADISRRACWRKPKGAA